MLSDWINFGGILATIRIGIIDLINTDYSQIQYSNKNLAIWVGAIIGLLILTKLAFVLMGRNKNSREDSGYFIYKQNQIGSISKVILLLPKLVLAVFIASIITAIADPFMSVAGEEVTQIDTRMRVDLRDVSESMASPLRVTGGQPFRIDGKIKSAAEIAAIAHIEFLKMRRGQGDRTSFWLFSSDPFLIQDFIVDDEVYFLSVFDAPWVMTGSDYPDIFDPEFGMGPYFHPKSRHAKTRGQGGTNLHRVLQAVIRQFDEDEAVQKLKNPSYKRGRRSVLIVTDAMVSSIESIKRSISELYGKNTVVYLIYVGLDPNSSGSQSSQSSQKVLLDAIVNQGGKYFAALNPAGLEAAYREIDNLEKSNVVVESSFLKQSVFYKFLFFGILVLVLIIPIGLISELFDVYP